MTNRPVRFSIPFGDAMRQTSGNVSVLFALAVVPMILAAGAAVDYVRASRAQTELQAAVDGAALAAAMADGADTGNQKLVAESYFRKNFQTDMVGELEPDVTIKKDAVTVSAAYDYPTSFMALAGINSMKIAGSSSVEGGSDRNAEIAMVLDYSYSMVTSNKYVRMRDAATKMIDSLAAAQHGADLKIGLVPFSAMVRGSMSSSYVSQPSASSTWTGCTQDRNYPLNTGISTPDGTAATQWGYIDAGGSDNNFSTSYNCAKYGTDSLDIVPLTDDLATVKSKLATMFPLGNTNIPLGVEFGWNLLDPDAPYTEGASYSDDLTKKFIVLLTDGVETSRQWGSGNSRNVTNANNNLLALCANIAAKEITVFAIAYDVTDPKVTSLLKTCAGSNYFEASKTGDEIDQVFKTITTRIKKTTLRVAR